MHNTYTTLAQHFYNTHNTCTQTICIQYSYYSQITDTTLLQHLSNTCAILQHFNTIHTHINSIAHHSNNTYTIFTQQLHDTYMAHTIIAQHCTHLFTQHLHDTCMAHTILIKLAPQTQHLYNTAQHLYNTCTTLTQHLHNTHIMLAQHLHNTCNTHIRSTLHNSP
eukprot:Phypoly_transcript_03897.p1 GENE.Phypoly_transcript_03897~~Phypoly_transcript_03897.p1  ORF type:complete len:165 (-),score=5.26 Phypoly_transcript_03897:516-1010(-)